MLKFSDVPSDLSSSVNTLVICDPEPVAMEGLRSLLEGTGGARVVAAETNLEDTACAMAELHPDLLLVDQKFGALDLRRLLSLTESTAAVIVWGACISEREALCLFQAGVSGVVSKRASLRDLADCVRAVASGRKWMDICTEPAFIH